MLWTLVGVGRFWEAAVRCRTGAIARAGVFLLFALVLAMLAPLEASAEAVTPSQPGVADTKNEGKGGHEHKDTEKLGERLPRAALNQRFRDVRTGPQPLPKNWRRQGEFTTSLLARAAMGSASGPDDPATRSRHSPASLQVYRH